MKDIIKKILDIPKDLFKRFPASIGVAILLTIFLVIFLENDIMKDIIAFLLILPVGIFFSEILFNNKTHLKTISFILSIIIAILSNKYILEGNSLITKFTIIYVIALIIIGLIKLFKDSKLSIGEYLTRVYSNIFKTQLIFSVLSSGVMMLGLIFMILFLKEEQELFIVRLELLVGGIYYIPAMLYSFSDTKAKPWEFIVFILKNIASVILIMSFAIIYLYMLKIAITWNIPSNHIFRIIGLLFIIGLPIWTVVNSLKDENILVKISKKIPLAFIPLIVFQTYSLVVRIASNGLTIMRYVGIMLLILEVIYSVIYVVKEDNVYYIGYVIIIMFIIGLIVPKINAIDLTVDSQYRVMMKLLEKEKISSKEHSRLYSAYRYLQDYKEGKKYLVNLTKEQIEFITEAKEVEYDCYYKDRIDLYNLEVTGYSKISEFEVTSYDEDISFADLENVDVKGYSVDFSSYIKHFIKSEQGNTSVKYSDTIVEDNYKIDVNEVQVCIEDSDLESYTISGYILEK